MTILYCHSKYYEESQYSVRHYAPDAVWVNTSGSSFAYSEAFERYWDEAGDLIVIEHDIVIDKTTIPAFSECQEPWCSFSFDVMGQYIDFALGCTKWSSEARKLIRPPHRENWRTLDVRLRELFIWEGLRPHCHGRLAHLHPYQPGMNRFDENIGILLDQGKAAWDVKGCKGPPLPVSGLMGKSQE